MSKFTKTKREEIISEILNLLVEFRQANEREKEINLLSLKSNEAERLSQIYNEYQSKSNETTSKFSDQVDHFREKVEEFHDKKNVQRLNEQKNYEDEVLSIINKVGLVGLPWNWKEWQVFEKDYYKVSSDIVRIGTFSSIAKVREREIPTLINLNSIKNIVYHTHGDAQETCSENIQSVLLRLLAVFPSDLLRIHVYDPLGLGENSKFLEPNNQPLIFRNGVLSDRRIIETDLEEVLNYIKEVRSIQGRSKYRTFEDYNSEVKGHHLEYHYLVFYDFPEGYSQQAAEYISIILRSGLGSGVFVILHNNRLRKISSAWKWDENIFSKLTVNIRVKNSYSAEWDNELFKYEKINLDQVPTSVVIDHILAQVGMDKSLENNRNILPFEDIAVSPSEWGNGTGTYSLSVPIGTLTDGSLYEFSLGEQGNSAHHAIIGGMIGSGKGNLIRVLLTQLLSKYSKDELNLYLLDFKQAQDLANYGKYQLPQIRTLVMQTDPLSGLAILRWLVEEKERRSIKLAYEGGGAEKIEEFFERTKMKIPRIVLVMDEFTKLLEDKQCGQEAQDLLKELAKEGRAYGIHIILATQSLDNLAEMRAAYAQMRLRICLPVMDPSHSERILGSNNYGGNTLKLSGQAIINDDLQGKLTENKLIRIALLKTIDQEKILEKLILHYGKSRTRVLGVIQPKKITEIDNSHQYLLEEDIRLDGNAILLGQSSELKNSSTGQLEAETVSYFNNERGANLLIVGSYKEQAISILQSAIASLSQKANKGRNIIFISSKRDEVENRNIIGDFINYVDFVTEENIFSKLTSLNRLMSERHDSYHSSEEQNFLIICAGLGKISTLRNPIPKVKEVGITDFTPSFSSIVIGNLLGNILREGPGVGINSVIWAESLSDLKTLGISPEDDLMMRVALSRLPVEATLRVLGLSVGKLRPSTYSYYRELSWDTRFERFLPYSLLEKTEISIMAEKFMSRRIGL